MKREKITKKEIRDNILSKDTLELIKIEIKKIRHHQFDNNVELQLENKLKIYISISPTAATYLETALHKISDKFVFLSPYQALDKMSRALGARSVCGILDTRINSVIGGRIEFTLPNDEVVFVKMLAGDILCYTQMANFPCYIIKEIVYSLKSF